MSTLSPGYHLAQINVARAKAATDDPLMADFMAQLDEINARAETAAGFVWRLKGDNNNATAIQVFDDPLIIINMSVWASLEDLYQYTYYSDHVGVFRRREEWFEPFGRPHLALWWVPAGELPSAAEGRRRLEHLQVHGPTPHAFTFKQRFPAPAAERLKPPSPTSFSS